jgi:aspartate aminotransferase
MVRSTATRVNRVRPPATLAAGQRARDLAQQGKDVIDLGPSSPHYATPRHIIDAGVKALRDGLTNQAPTLGIPEFRRALSQKLSRDNGLQADPEGDLMVVPGSKQGLYYAANAYTEPGDEVLLVEPTWVSFRQQVELAEATPVAVPLSAEEEYHLSYEALERYATDRTSMVILNNPQNPTGRVYTRSELEDVARFARERDLLVVCDETYEYFVYGSNRHLTLASLPGMWERTVTSFTFTKAYSMSGWRLGCMVAPSDVLEPLVRVQEHTASFVSPFIQMAGLAALRGPQDHIRAWTDECAELRRQVADRLNAVPGVHCPLTEGATFLFPRFSGSLTSAELVERLLAEVLVSVTPGSGFGESGEGHFRIALMRSPAERVLEGAERIAGVLEKIA